MKAVKEDYQNRVNQRGDTDLDPALQALYVALGRVKIDARHFRTIISTTQDFLWLKVRVMMPRKYLNSCSFVIISLACIYQR